MRPACWPSGTTWRLHPLSHFAAEIPGDQQAGPALWPAHFDAGMTAAAISHAASPFDDHIADPYLYAGPHDDLPPGGPAFWNAPFGAVRIFGHRRHRGGGGGLVR